MIKCIMIYKFEAQVLGMHNLVLNMQQKKERRNGATPQPWCQPCVKVKTFERCTGEASKLLATS